MNSTRTRIKTFARKIPQTNFARMKWSFGHKRNLWLLDILRACLNIDNDAGMQNARFRDKFPPRKKFTSKAVRFNPSTWFVVTICSRRDKRNVLYSDDFLLFQQLTRTWLEAFSMMWNVTRDSTLTHPNPEILLCSVVVVTTLPRLVCIA